MFDPDLVTNLICTPPWPVASAVLPAVVTVTSSTESIDGVSRFEAAAGAIQSCAKAFYVSPFMDMDLVYHFRLTAPAERVAVSIEASKGGERILSAHLGGVRSELSDRALLKCFGAIPLITIKVVLAIHWEALRLWIKGSRLRDRPRRVSA